MKASRNLKTRNEKLDERACAVANSTFDPPIRLITTWGL